MDIIINWTFLPHTDAEASLAFYRDVLGFEVRKDVGNGRMRWITVGSPDQADVSIVLHPPAVEPGTTDEERATIIEMMEKGNYGRIVLGTRDLDSVFDKVQAAGTEVLQEPTAHPYGMRDCAFRDPAGNQIRIQELE